MTPSQQAPSLVEPLNELSAWLSEHNIDMQMPVGMIDPAEAAARITELEGDLKAALREVSKYAREAGEAKGRLEMSEAAGIVEGWRERAERAEARCRALESASPAEPSGWRPIESEKHELDCLRRQVGQLDYPCSPHCAGYLREFAMRNTAVKALRLYTRRTDSGVGAHVIVEIERHDGSTAEIIREFADISDTIIDHWARLPPTSEGGGV